MDSRKQGMATAVTTRTATSIAATAANTPERSDLRRPRSSSATRRADSAITVMANANTGKDTNVAKEVSGRTAPISSGETYFGTNHMPAARFTASPIRMAMNMSAALFAKEPIFIAASISDFAVF